MTVTVDRDRLRRTTAPHLLCERARTMPDSIAFRSKHFGIYRERRWRDYAALVTHAARALQDLGIEPRAARIDRQAVGRRVGGVGRLVARFVVHGALVSLRRGGGSALSANPSAISTIV